MKAPFMIHRPTYQLGVLLGIYVIFLFYSALFPFHQWRLPESPVVYIVLFNWINYIFLFDIVQNLFMFIPFGFLACGYLMLQGRRGFTLIYLPTLAAFLMSFFIETMQTYNPARIPSLLDTSLNTTSGLLGAILALPLMRYYPNVVSQIQQSITLTHMRWSLLGMMAWLIWGCYQLYPFIPTFYPKELWDSIAPLSLFFQGEIELQPETLALFSLQGTLLFFAGKLFLTPDRCTWVLLGYVMFMLIGNIFIINKDLSFELVFGTLGSIALLAMAQKGTEALAQLLPKMATANLR